MRLISHDRLAELYIDALSDACDMWWDLRVVFPPEGTKVDSDREAHYWPDSAVSRRKDRDEEYEDDDEDGDAYLAPEKYENATRKWCVRHVLRAAGSTPLRIKYDCVLETGSKERTTGETDLDSVVLLVHARDADDPYEQIENAYVFRFIEKGGETTLHVQGIFPELVIEYSSNGQDDTPNEVHAEFLGGDNVLVPRPKRGRFEEEEEDE